MLRYAILLIILFTAVALSETGEIQVHFCPNCTGLYESFNLSNCAFYSSDLKGDFLIHHTNYKGQGKPIQNRGLMHHKFCVQNNWVILGSANPTKNDLEKNPNNLILINSKTLARNYENELKYLKGQNVTTTTNFYFNFRPIKNYFCPRHPCRELIINELNQAKHSIYFLTFTFTDTEIANVLKEKHKQGLQVKGLIENFQSKTYWVHPIIQNFTYVHTGEFQHNKIFIIDEKTVITGSYNPTRAAHTINNENILVLNQPEVARKYIDYFTKIFINTTNISINR